MALSWANPLVYVQFTLMRDSAPMRFWAATTLALVFATHASAAELSVVLKTGAGKPVRDAVVTVHPAVGASMDRVRFAWPLQVVQHHMQFNPFVLIVPAGGEVSFPNRDNTRHHVYSFSPTRPFELKLYGKEEARTVRFDKAGVVALGCNIHDSMVGFIKVVDTPYAAKTAADGSASVTAPRGAAVVRIWHPYLRSPGNEVVRRVVLADGAPVREALTVQLRPAPISRGHY
jgi:plastocyanin